MSCCSFSVCSLLTDVRDSVTEMPRDPDEVKSLLFEHLGFGNKPESSGVGKAGSGSGDTCLSSFKHPISYTDPEKLHELAPSIIEDLELLHVKPKMTVGGGVSNSEEGVEGVPTDDAVNGLYHYVFSPKSVYRTEHLPIWSK